MCFIFFGMRSKDLSSNSDLFLCGSIKDLIQMIFFKHCSHSSSIGFAGCSCTITMLFLTPFGFALCFQTTHQKVWLQENCICFIICQQFILVWSDTRYFCHERLNCTRNCYHKESKFRNFGLCSKSVNYSHWLFKSRDKNEYDLKENLLLLCSTRKGMRP